MNITPPNAPHPSPLPQWAFVLIDQTTSVTPPSLRPAPHFSAILLALKESAGTLIPTWGIGACSFRAGKSPQDRGLLEIACHFRDAIPEAPDALAYHTVTNGVPDIEIGCDLFGDVLNGPESQMGGLDHEFKETVIDPGGNLWADLFDGSGMMRAREACDTVQNSGYPARVNGAWLSNFLLPAAFIPGAPGKWDFMGVMTSQEDYSHGYEIQAGSPSDVTQVGGKKRLHGLAMSREGTRMCGIAGAERLSTHQLKRKAHPYSRTYRRGVRIIP
jgi:hypothetical protein